MASPFKPTLIVLDYETALTNGSPSVEYYRDDFRVVSAALAWRRQDGSRGTRYLVGEAEVREGLESVRRSGAKCIVHNYQFEYGVTRARFPGFEDLMAVDTMRLAQVCDNGGKKAQWLAPPLTLEQELDALDNPAAPPTSGLGLQDCASRFLTGDLTNHKEPFYAYLRDYCGVRKGQEGRNLNLLPETMARDYNVADVVVTLELHDAIVAKLAAENYDWRFDHELYKASARRIASAKSRGVRVDRERLAASRAKIATEVAALEAAFRLKYKAALTKLETAAADAWINEVKTVRGRDGRRAVVAANFAEFQFNIGSNQQLARLFVDTLGIKPKFMTEESKASRAKRKAAIEAGEPEPPPFVPQPSFKAAHLPTYGEGGEMLVQRRKRLLVQTQCDSLLALSAYDGRFHIDLKACGTTTGRFAGGRA